MRRPARIIIGVTVVLTAIVVCMVSTTTPRAAAGTPGDLDPAWGVHGFVVGDFGVGADTLNGAIALPDGGFFLQGTHSDPAGDSLAVGRYTAAGALDPAYGAGGQVLLAHSEIAARLNVGTVSPTLGFSVSALSLQPGSEKLVGIVTYMTDAGGTFGIGLLRLNADGSLDTSLDGDGVKPLTAADLAPQWTDGTQVVCADHTVQNDGKVVVVGTVDPAATNRDYCVLRYTADGAPDPEFATGGRFTKDLTNRTEDVCSAVALQPDGKIVVIGRSGMDQNGVVGALRLTPSGALDPSFGEGGVHVEMGLPNAPLAQLAVQPDGKLICWGPGAWNATVLRLNADGSRDQSFAALQVEGTPTEVAIQGDGKLIMGGWVNRGYPFYRDAWVSRFDPAGNPDIGFGEGGTVYVDYGAADDCTAVRLLADGKILVAGYQYAGTGRFLAASAARGAETDYFAARLVNDVTRLTKPAATIVTRPARLTLRWRLWNAAFPLASYDVVGHSARWNRTMPAAPTMMLATHTAATSLRLPKAVQPGWTYRFCTRAVAAGGETSAWSPKTVIVPLDERAGKRSGPWRAGTDRRCYLSTYLRSTPNKSCSISFGKVPVVQTVGVIATTGPKAPKWRGVRIYLNKTPQTLSLRTARTKTCQAIYVRFKKPVRNAKISVVVLADRPVTIEGIILSPE